MRISFDGLNGRRDLLEFDVDVGAGEVTTHTVALFGDDLGDRDRYRAARKGVRYVAPTIPDIEPRERDGSSVRPF